MKQFLRTLVLEPLLRVVSGAISACGGHDIVAEHEEAMQLVRKMANVDIWAFEQHSGMPYEERTEPEMGYLSSHCILMDAVIAARWIIKVPPVKCGACGFAGAACFGSLSKCSKA